MTTRSVSRVWMGRLLRVIAALTLALTAAVAPGLSVAAASTPVDPGVSWPAGSAVPAGGRAPTPRDDRLRATPVPTTTRRPSRGNGAVVCPPTATAVPTAAGSRRRPTVAPTPMPCPVSRPVAQRTPVPTAPLTAAAATSTAQPQPAAANAPAVSPVPRAPRPLPVPPPLRLTPSLVPVPQSYSAQLAPTSVLVLGFGSVALATAAMTLRLLRRGR
jgi:hypothetical protein